MEAVPREFLLTGRIRFKEARRTQKTTGWGVLLVFFSIYKCFYKIHFIYNFTKDKRKRFLTEFQIRRCTDGILWLSGIKRKLTSQSFRTTVLSSFNCRSNEP